MNLGELIGSLETLCEAYGPNVTVLIPTIGYDDDGTYEADDPVYLGHCGTVGIRAKEWNAGATNAVGSNCTKPSLAIVSAITEEIASGEKLFDGSEVIRPFWSGFVGGALSCGMTADALRHSLFDSKDMKYWWTGMPEDVLEGVGRGLGEKFAKKKQG